MASRNLKSRAVTSIVASQILTLSILLTEATAQPVTSPSDLANLSLEELTGIEITSVSKKAESLSDAAAAIYVISREAIQRAGATSLPEILRLAPNLQVARITAQSYAISARGFNGTSSDKLLVLIDGRSVYLPFANGVFWEFQEVLPDNIERIEVISGPGATLWGANAVNGVINIITRTSDETLGGALEAGGGNLERRASLQYGGSLGDMATYRAYLSGFAYDRSVTAAGTNAQDNWDKFQSGFRTDWSLQGDQVTFQGDYYAGSLASSSLAAANLNGTDNDLEITGHNLLARWSHPFGGGSMLEVQAYYDHVAVTGPNGLDEHLNTYDLDVQHGFTWGNRQEIVWGGGYRIQEDSLVLAVSSAGQFFDPRDRRLNLGNLFIQDNISLLPSLRLTLGAKIENGPYSNAQLLPGAKLSWKVSNTDLLWSGVSRAIRAPSRFDRDFFEAQGALTLFKGGDFRPEKVITYELGYRSQPLRQASLSIAAYYNRYQDLRNAEVTAGGFPPIPAALTGVPDGGYPLLFGNGIEGDTYGIELWGNYQLTEWWRLDAGFNWLHKDLHFKPGASIVGGTDIVGNDPDYQFSLRSSMNLRPDVALDLDLRSIDSLPAPASPSYTELNARLGWTVSESLQVSVRGANLLHKRHLEFGSTLAAIQLGAIGVETGRSFYIDMRWKF